MTQAALKFEAKPTYHAQDFLVSACNKEAYGWVQQWPNWPFHALVIYGPPHSGKTHLAHIFKERSDAVFIPPQKIGMVNSHELLGGHRCAIIESLEKVKNEEGLFHLLNFVAGRKDYLLITSHIPPAQVLFTLPDLRSRLGAIAAVKISAPDDNLLKAVITKQFADRQLRVPAEVIDYMLPRMERSFEAAAGLVARIDEASLAAHRNITLPLVKKVMD